MDKIFMALVKARRHIRKVQEHKLNELPFEKNIPRTPAEIFLAIDNQSINRAVGESLIERYGDCRVMEAIAGLHGYGA
jgi:hypothetical protein